MEGEALVQWFGNVSWYLCTMTKYSPITLPKELDFFSIYEEDGIKYIHVFGYSYKSSNSEYTSADNPSGTYWANMECCGFLFPLAEFIKGYAENPDFMNDTYCEVPQYQDDLTADEMVKTINTYFDGRPADAYLPFGEITMETVCGDYVC